MKREHLHRLIALATITIIVTTIGLLVSGCSDDCPTCPKPPVETRYDGRLYVTGQYWGDSVGGLFVVDTKTDSILDSIVYRSREYGVFPTVTDDGKYLAVNLRYGRGVVQIYNAATLEVVTELPSMSTTSFVKNSTVLLGIRDQTIMKYTVPGFDLIGSGTLESGDVDKEEEVYFNSRTNMIYGIRYIDTADLHLTSLVAIDFDSLLVRKTWRPLPPYGPPYGIKEFALHPNGRFAYLIATWESVDFVVYDLDSSRVISTFPMFFWGGDIKVDSVNNLVYVCDPGIPGQTINPGVIYTFEALTGKYRGGISLDGYMTEGYHNPPFDAWDLAISPDGSSLYAITGHMLTRGGTVLSINTKTREIEKLIFPKIDHLFTGLVVGPTPKP